MKAFEWNEEEDLQHPQDMNLIIKFLEDRGTINVKPKKLEKLYQAFSDKYDSSWLSVHGLELTMSEEEYEEKYGRPWLHDFARWLADCDV